MYQEIEAKEKEGRRKLKEERGEIARKASERGFLSHEMQKWPANQVREERPAVSSRDVTQVYAGGTETAGGQCS